MTTTQPTPPAPFTTEDYAAGCDASWPTPSARGWTAPHHPGPDLVWLTGYQPTAITERLTMLVLTPGQEPTLLVPTLERPDAEGAVGAPGLTIVDWADGEDPFARPGYLRETATMGIADSAWAMHLLGLQEAVPGSSYRSLTQSLPMLRAVKDADELARLDAAGAAADATYEQILGVGSPAGRRPTSRPTWPGCCGSSGTSRSTSPWSAPAPTAPIPTTRPVTAPSRSATRWSSTSAD